MDRPEAGERRGCVSSGGDAGGDVRADVSAFGTACPSRNNGRDVDYRLYFICEGGRRILPVDKPSVMSGAFNGGVNPLADCEIITAENISELIDASALLPAVEAGEYLFR